MNIRSVCGRPADIGNVSPDCPLFSLIPQCCDLLPQAHPGPMALSATFQDVSIGRHQEGLCLSLSPMRWRWTRSQIFAVRLSVHAQHTSNRSVVQACFCDRMDHLTELGSLPLRQLSHCLSIRTRGESILGESAAGISAISLA